MEYFMRLFYFPESNWQHLKLTSQKSFLPIVISPMFGSAGYEWRCVAEYNENVARGWESKSVEAQQAEASEKSGKPKLRLTAEAAARQRERETLRLSRQRVLQQLEASQNPRHCELLEQELADLDEKISRFKV
jgi:hypothetical protein